MNRKEFLKLQREWYAKLAKETDFVDIERHSQLSRAKLADGMSSEPTLARFDSHYFRSRNTIETMAIKQSYYALASDFLVEWGDFLMSDTEIRIWEMYIDGKSTRKIAEALNEQGVNVVRRTNKDNVNQAIQDMETMMYAVMNA